MVSTAGFQKLKALIKSRFFTKTFSRLKYFPRLIILSSLSSFRTTQNYFHHLTMWLRPLGWNVWVISKVFFSLASRLPALTRKLPVDLFNFRTYIYRYLWPINEKMKQRPFELRADLRGENKISTETSDIFLCLVATLTLTTCQEKIKRARVFGLG